MDITAARSTAHSADALWATLEDIDQWAQWLPTVDSVARVGGPGVPGVGVAYELEQPGLPKATWTITDWRPGVGFTWESRRPGVLTIATHELVGESAGARIELDIKWKGLLGRGVRMAFGAKTANFLRLEAEALDVTTTARVKPSSLP
jgi:hypothetical protein